MNFLSLILFFTIRNIYLQIDETSGDEIIKIGDFGISKIAFNKAANTLSIGTPVII